MQLEQLREAHQHCLAILKLDPSFADAWFLCGVIAAHNGLHSKSVEIIDKAVGLAPDNPEYRAELGKQLLADQRPERALEGSRGGTFPQAIEPAHLKYTGHRIQLCRRTSESAAMLRTCIAFTTDAGRGHSRTTGRVAGRAQFQPCRRIAVRRAFRRGGGGLRTGDRTGAQHVPGPLRAVHPAPTDTREQSSSSPGDTARQSREPAGPAADWFRHRQGTGRSETV